MHWRRWQAVGADSWTVSILRDGYRLPFESPPLLTRTPILFPAYRPGSPQSLALRQEIEKMLARSGPRRLQPPLPGGKGDGKLAPRDRPVDSEHLHSTDTVQDGDCSLRLERCPRERSPRLPGLEGRVLPGARPSKFQEVSALCVTGDSVPVQGSLLRTVHCPPSLHESVRSSVSVGAHSRNSASPLLGRLAGSSLLGDQGPSARPRPALVLSRSGDRGQRGEVRSRALTFCKLSRNDDRHSGGQGFSLESKSGEIPSPGGQLCKDELPPPARQWEVLLGHLSSLEKLVPRS